MHFQFLIEDHSTSILVGHVMKKMQDLYPTEYITFDMKSFGGIGGLKKTGTPIKQKTDKLLNSLPYYLRAFDRSLVGLEQAVVVVVLDNDKHDPVQFRRKLENLARENMLQKSPIFGIAIKEMEAWLLGDVEAIKAAYPHVKDMGETATKFQQWWDSMAQKYQWEGSENGSWEINFQTNEIILVAK